MNLLLLEQYQNATNSNKPKKHGQRNIDRRPSRLVQNSKSNSTPSKKSGIVAPDRMPRQYSGAAARPAIEDKWRAGSPGFSAAQMPMQLARRVRVTLYRSIHPTP
jgi:hypothetical protein